MVTKAYSYIRFSSPEQAAGDSLRRQMAGARDYAARQGLALQDVSFQDLGVSGFHGDNAESGHLAEFIDAVKLGVIEKGSVLLIESLDRLSRMKPRKAVRLLENILDLGIDVVTLTDGKRYSQRDIDDEPLTMMIAFMVALRAHEESKVKGQRVRAAWAQKKLNAKAGVIVTKRIPSWLKIEEGKFVVIEEKADAVRQVFQLAAKGVGQLAITRQMNRDKVPPLKGKTAWHKSAVMKLLNSESVRGTYVPHDVVRVDGAKKRIALEPVEGYYPRIIDEQLWLDTRSAKPKGAASTEVRNVLSGIGRCSRCGGAVTRISKNQRDVYLVCQTARNGAGCKYQTERYRDVELAVLQINPIADYSISSDDTLRREYLNAMASIDALKDTIADALRLKSATARATIAELDSTLVELEKERERLAIAVEENEPALLMARLDRLKDALDAEPLDRRLVNQLLRQLVDSLETRFDSGDPTVHWKDGAVTEQIFRWVG